MTNPSRLTMKLFAACAFAAVAPMVHAGEFHHVHLNTTDPAAALEWYTTHMGGVETAVGPFKAAGFGKTTILFFRKTDRIEGSHGSAVDHIGFSFEDLEAKMKQLEEAGVDIVAPVRQVGPIKFAFVKDPWGTLIEVLQDEQLYGFHHIHLHTPNPEETLGWYTKQFGGEITRFYGLIPAVRYGDVWVLAQRNAEEKAPTKGRAINHLGFGLTDMDAATARMKEDGVEFVMEPRPFAGTKIAFIAGPDGVLFELVGIPAAE